MDKKEKQRKRSRIAQTMDVTKTHLKDSEIDALFAIVSDPDAYDGKSKTVKKSHIGWCSDGKYTREEETTYTLLSDDDGVRIKEKYGYSDDDGQSGKSECTYTSARDILRILATFFQEVFLR